MEQSGRSGSRDGTPEGLASSYDLTRLSWSEVEQVLKDEPRLLFAVGSLEQHGRHLPLGTNVLIADRVVHDVSESAGVLRAPTLEYGVRAPTWRDFPGAAGLRRKTLHRAVNELLAAWEAAGIEELIVVTANRYEQHLDALLMALTSEATTTVIDLRSIPVDDILDGDPESEHGGELETSLLLHLAPEQVRRDEIRDYVPDPGTLRKYVEGGTPSPPPGSGGAVGRPSLATQRKGRRVFRRFVRVLRTRVLGED